MSNSVFSGVRILDVCSLAAGPYCAKLLADMGAEVIKVESPEGDPARRYGAFAGDKPDRERSALFLYCNTNKMGVTLNLRTATGRRLLHELAKQADVLVEDAPPQEEKALGLDYDTLRNVNPKLIVTSITPFGKTGPHSTWKAYPLNTYHAGGEGFLLPGEPTFSMFPDREPIKAGGFAGEYDSGIYGASAVAAALYERTASGQGQHIDVSGQEVQLQLNRMSLIKLTAEDTHLTRAGRGYEFGGIFKARNGYVICRPTEDNHFESLCQVVDDPALKDERFKARAGRLKHGPEINKILARCLAEQDKEDFYLKIGGSGCPAGYFAAPEDLVKSPQLKHRKFFTEIDHPEAGRFLYPTVPYKMPASPARYDRPAPLLGQHNAAVFCDRLGLSRAELVQLRQTGVI